jgi:VCBS repeat-containing protein
VTITGTNDAPSITSTATGTVAENAPTSTVIYTASATDVDAGDTRTYSLKTGTGDISALNINASTGAVTLVNPANYEAKSSYSFTVEATDAGGLKAEKAVVVSVTNVNEAPVFTPSTASITYTDTSATDSFSSSSGTFIATDVDTAPPLTYGIAGGTLSGGVVTKMGSYGTLAVTASTGAYTFTPNNSGINTLSTAATENYTVTASDGFLTSNLIYTVNANGVTESAVNGVNFAWYAYAGNFANPQGSALTVTGTSRSTSTRSDFYLDDASLSAAVGIQERVFIRAYASIVIPDIAGSTFILNLATNSDDGVEVWIDKGLGWESVISNRTDHAPFMNYSQPITVPDNSTIPIKVEWWENGGGAVLDVLWSPTSGGAANTRLTGSSLLAIGTATPLILDLNNDGVHTLAADDVIQYDLLGTGTPASVGWSSPEDGFLVFDINNDGVINDGSEMFGEATRLSNGGLASNGFEALIDLDFNLDGVLDLNDPLFSYLQIWKDANSDGITDLGELFSLADQNITSFDVHPQEANRVENGNQIKLVSTYSTADGVQHEIADVWLKVAFNPDVPTPIIG